MPYQGVRGDFLLGLVMEGNAFALEEKAIGGCVFFVLTLPQGSLRRRIALRRGARELQRQRVRRCVFPEEFSQQAYFQQAEWDAYMDALSEVALRLMDPENNDTQATYTTYANNLKNQVARMEAAVSAPKGSNSYTYVI